MNITSLCNRSINSIIVDANAPGRGVTQNEGEQVPQTPRHTKFPQSAFPRLQLRKIFKPDPSAEKINIERIGRG